MKESEGGDNWILRQHTEMKGGIAVGVAMGADQGADPRFLSTTWFLDKTSARVAMVPMALYFFI